MRDKVVEQLTMHKRFFILADVCLLALGASVTIGWLYWKNSLVKPPTVPKDTLPPSVRSLKFKINTVSGEITEIGKDTLTIAVALPKNLTPTPLTSITPTPEPDKTHFKVSVNSSTAISLLLPEVPYLFKSPQQSTKRVSLSELHVGEHVAVEMAKDIREIDTDKLLARSIQVSTLNTIEGTIKEINKQNVTLEAYPPSPAYAFNVVKKPDRLVNYTLTITPETEISYYFEQNGSVMNKRQVSADSLTPGMYIKVYAGSDLEFARNGTALRIEPLRIVPGQNDNFFIIPTGTE